MRRWLVVVSFAFVGCAERPSSPPPTTVNVSTVDGGTAPSPDAAGPNTPEELERVVSASVALLEGYVARCGRGALVGLHMQEASLYADRDEIVLRQQRPRGGWSDRDVPAWLRDARARERELRSVTASPCPAR